MARKIALPRLAAALVRQSVDLKRLKRVLGPDKLRDRPIGPAITKATARALRSHKRVRTRTKRTKRT